MGKQNQPPASERSPGERNCGGDRESGRPVGGPAASWRWGAPVSCKIFTFGGLRRCFPWREHPGLCDPGIILAPYSFPDGLPDAAHLPLSLFFLDAFEILSWISLPCPFLSSNLPSQPGWALARSSRRARGRDRGGAPSSGERRDDCSAPRGGRSARIQVVR